MYNKILVIRFSSLGDVVLAEPVFRALKQKHPQAQIAFATKKEYAGILEGHSGIDWIFSLDRDFDKFTNDVRGFNPDLIIDLHKTIRSRKLSRQFPNAQKLAYPKARLKRFLKVLTKSRKPVAHTMERYLKTIEPNDSMVFPQLSTPQTENHRRWVEPPGFTVGFGLGAKWKTKRWPVGYFSRLAQLLSETFP
ncbi:MAG: glycosyltransferase family 9 protein, partial [candidate division Zixibacteria bacterium]|nr:glycosyltransferase family 9 protein [candidate division Zixibacteria bacterium]